MDLEEGGKSFEASGGAQKLESPVIKWTKQRGPVWHFSSCTLV